MLNEKCTINDDNTFRHAVQKLVDWHTFFQIEELCRSEFSDGRNTGRDEQVQVLRCGAPVDTEMPGNFVDGETFLYCSSSCLIRSVSPSES